MATEEGERQPSSWGGSSVPSSGKARYLLAGSKSSSTLDPQRQAGKRLPAKGAPNHIEHRVSARREFESWRRARELEREGAAAEARRQAEEEEEEAYREARKRSVPRAHVVPDWYERGTEATESRVSEAELYELYLVLCICVFECHTTTSARRGHCERR